MRVVSIVLGLSGAISANSAVFAAASVNDRVAKDWDYNGRVILGHIGYDICEWDARSGKLLWRLPGHTEQIVSAELSPDGRRAITTSYYPPNEAGIPSKDTSTRLWDLVQGRQIKELDGEIGRGFSADGHRILTVKSGDGTALAFIGDENTGERLGTFQVAGNDVAFSPSGREICANDGGGFTYVYDSRTGVEVGRCELTDGFRRHVKFGTNDGTLLGYDTYCAELWDIKANKPIVEISNEKDKQIADMNRAPLSVPEAALDKNGTLVLTPAWFGANLYETKSGRLAFHLEAPATCWAIDLSPGGNYALVQSLESLSGGPFVGTAWDLRKRKLVRKFGDTPVCFSKDGKTFLTETEHDLGYKNLTVYSSETGAILRRIDLHSMK